ncbi:MAG: hypothetical protein EOO29_38860, partial [Comamonadaceae bacterium]
ALRRGHAVAAPGAAARRAAAAGRRHRRRRRPAAAHRCRGGAGIAARPGAAHLPARRPDRGPQDLCDRRHHRAGRRPEGAIAVKSAPLIALPGCTRSPHGRPRDDDAVMPMHDTGALHP